MSGTTELTEAITPAKEEIESGDNEKVRLSVYLHQDLVKVLRDIGRSAGLKDAEVIRYLIALGQTVHQEIERGNQLATTKDGETVNARIVGVM